jgi:hypothetical protein
VDDGHNSAGLDIVGSVVGAAYVSEQRGTDESGAELLELVLIPRDNTTQVNHFARGVAGLVDEKAKDRAEPLSDSEYETAYEG